MQVEAWVSFCALELFKYHRRVLCSSTKLISIANRVNVTSIFTFFRCYHSRHLFTAFVGARVRLRLPIVTSTLDEAALSQWMHKNNHRARYSSHSLCWENFMAIQTFFDLKPTMRRRQSKQTHSSWAAVFIISRCSSHRHKPYNYFDGITGDSHSQGQWQTRICMKLASRLNLSALDAQQDRERSLIELPRRGFN